MSLVIAKKMELISILRRSASLLWIVCIPVFWNSILMNFSRKFQFHICWIFGKWCRNCCIKWHFIFKAFCSDSTSTISYSAGLVTSSLLVFRDFCVSVGTLSPFVLFSSLIHFRRCTSGSKQPICWGPPHVGSILLRSIYSYILLSDLQKIYLWIPDLWMLIRLEIRM